MKRILSTALCAIALFTSCEKDKVVSPVTFKVEIDESTLGDVNSAPYTVTVTNTSTAVSTEFENVTDTVSVTVLPGLYTFVAKSSATVDGEERTIVGAVKNARILPATTTVPVTVKMAKTSPLIFKEIYYAGCSYKTGEKAEDGTESTDTYFRDQFYEIYNNSNDVVYADGLCICDTDFASYDYTLFYEFSYVDGTVASNFDYVFSQIIWQIPGTGTDYPIQPGESFIVAQWATNHQDESLSKGGSPVNLTCAEFEAIEAESTLWNGIVITDGPAVNMKMAVNAAGYAPPQWLTAVGGSNMVLFRPSTPLRQEDFLVNNDASWQQTYCEINVDDVLDAVQMIDGETAVEYLGMPVLLDVGYIWCDGTYNGQSVSRRQVGTLTNGSPKYADTNNTTKDFVLNQSPVIRRDNVGAPSWNTWK